MAPTDLVEAFVGNAHGNLAKVRELLDTNPDLLSARAPWNESAIEAATQTGNVAIIEYLISKGAPVDFFTSLVLGRTDQVASILRTDTSSARSRGVHDLPALYFAAVGGHVEIAQQLLDAGADANERAEAAAPIHGAVMSGSADMVRLLIAAGADVSALDYAGRSARMLAEDVDRADLLPLLK